jgi:hypothetical protein
MKKLLAAFAATIALVFSGTVYAQCDANATGFAAAGVNDCNAQQQGQGQAQGQQQGQQQGQGQGQGQLQAAIAAQGQLQGNVGNTSTMTVQSDASGNSVIAYAPSISSRSTTNCITTYSGSGGAGGSGSASIFSLGLSVPIRDEDCVMEQAIRTGFESSLPEAQQLALELYKHQVAAIQVREGHDPVEKVAMIDGTTVDVMFDEKKDAWVPKEAHPKFRRAAAIAYTEMLMKAGYEPNVRAPIKGYGEMMNVSYITVNGQEQAITDEVVDAILIEESIREDGEPGVDFQTTAGR